MPLHWAGTHISIPSPCSISSAFELGQRPSGSGVQAGRCSQSIRNPCVGCGQDIARPAHLKSITVDVKADCGNASLSRPAWAGDKLLSWMNNHAFMVDVATNSVPAAHSDHCHRRRQRFACSFEVVRGEHLQFDNVVACIIILLLIRRSRIGSE